MKSFITKILIVATMFATALYFAPRLPDKIPTHWNYAGKIDAYGDKTAIYLFPTICLVMVLLFSILQKVDPKKRNYEKFTQAWEVIQYSLLGFFCYIYGITIYASLHPLFDAGMAILFGVGLLFVILGNFMGKLRQNYMVGFRLPWTIDNEEVWNKTHRFGGKCMMLSGVLLMLDAWFGLYMLATLVVAILLISIVPLIYSYLIFREVSKR